MTTEEKMIHMFNAVHGKPSGACYTEIEYDENENPISVNLMKNGNACWEASKQDLLFDYITRNFDK